MGSTFPPVLFPFSSPFSACRTAVLLLLVFAPAETFAQTVDCQGTIRAWKADSSLRDYMSKQSCTCSNGANRMPVCTSTGGGSGGGGYGGSYRSNTQMMMMQAVLAPMLSGAFAPPSAPSGPSPEQLRQQELQKQQAEQARIAAEKAKKAALDSWLKSQSDEELRRQAEQEDKIKRGQQLHSQMQPVGGGKLEPFSFGETKPQMQTAGGGGFPTAQLSEFDRLMCSAFFSNMARESKSTVDARFYANQAELVMSGQPTYVDCKIPKASSEKLAERSKSLKKTYEAVDLKFKELAAAETKLTEAKEKMTAATARKDQATERVAELEQRASQAPPEQKEEVDDLLAQAQKQLQDANKELDESKNSEKTANDRMVKLEGEIMQMKSGMQTSMQGS